MPVLYADERGLYCPRGDFHVDPWLPVPRAVVTHAHGDHARPGMGGYLCTPWTRELLLRRLGSGAPVEALPEGTQRTIGAARVSLHPAGHMLGSAQVRVEVDGEVWVVSGDYKRAADPSCAPFEVVACDTFVTEATFALPIYRWPSAHEVAREIADWWQRGAGRASVLFCYALGKAQRLLAELARLTDRAVWVHGALEAGVEVYRAAGVKLLPTRRVVETEKGASFAGELVLAPPVAAGSTWMRRLGDRETAFASGWMRVRGTRRRRGVDRGFTLSDHADWPALLQTVRETGASRVLATHGSSDVLARALREAGLSAGVLATPWDVEAEGEGDA